MGSEKLPKSVISMRYLENCNYSFIKGKIDVQKKSRKRKSNI